ncbi:MAG: hypothetical protein P9M15_06935, partial [Candidatus Electryoneaceae bacterium]|nr:hypothetical protein [Candidatus Electryoneaceae bacterium]
MPLTWNDPIDEVHGLGPQRSDFLKTNGFATVGDLFLRSPLRFIDRRKSPPFSELINPPKEEITAVGRIESVGEKGFGRKRRLIAIISDGSGHLSGVWFSSYHYLKPKLKPGRLVVFSGKTTFFDGPQMIHPKVTYLDDLNDPDEDIDPVDLSADIGLIPIYPSGKEWKKLGLSGQGWKRLIRELFDDWDGSGPYIPSEIVREEKLTTLRKAIKGIHFPDTLDEYDIALKSLKFAELFHHQLLMIALRRRRQQGDGIIIKNDGQRRKQFVDGLPFELSDSQRKVLTDIETDFDCGRPMYRLLQGEVGSGKTVVALIAAAIAADSGYQ